MGIIRSLLRESLAQITIALFFILSAWWIVIYSSGTTDASANHTFGFIYGGFSLWGGILGFHVAKKWGGFKSVMGKAIFFLTLGLLLQAFGQYSFWYINYFLKIAVPYPGIPDIGYFGTIPFYILAAILLARVSGVKVSMKSYANKIQAIIIPLIILGIGYFLFLRDYDFQEVSFLQIILDFGYPLGQAMYISIGILTFSLSRGILGGIMKSRIVFIILAFFLQFLADYVFIYYHDFYFPASFIDYFYLLAYVAMSLSLIELKTVIKKV
jgi:hypothetical protein